VAARFWLGMGGIQLFRSMGIGVLSHHVRCAARATHAHAACNSGHSDQERHTEGMLSLHGRTLVPAHLQPTGDPPPLPYSTSNLPITTCQPLSDQIVSDQIKVHAIFFRPQTLLVQHGDCLAIIDSSAASTSRHCPLISSLMTFHQLLSGLDTRRICRG